MCFVILGKTTCPLIKCILFRVPVHSSFVCKSKTILGSIQYFSLTFTSSKRSKDKKYMTISHGLSFKSVFKQKIFSVFYVFAKTFAVLLLGFVFIRTNQNNRAFQFSQLLMWTQQQKLKNTVAFPRNRNMALHDSKWQERKG